MDTTEAPGTQSALELEVLLRVLALGNAFLFLNLCIPVSLLGLLLVLAMSLLALLSIPRLVDDVVDASGIVRGPRV